MNLKFTTKILLLLRSDGQHSVSKRVISYVVNTADWMWTNCCYLLKVRLEDLKAKLSYETIWSRIWQVADYWKRTDISEGATFSIFGSKTSYWRRK